MNPYSDHDPPPITSKPDIRDAQAEQDRRLRVGLGDELYEWLEVLCSAKKRY